MLSMFAAEVFLGWNSVAKGGPGLPRLSRARASRTTIANALEQQFRFEVCVRLRIFVVSVDFFSAGPPWKLGPGIPPGAGVVVRA